MQGVEQAKVLADFAKTLNSLPLIEISKAAPGTSSFNSAVYLSEISSEQIAAFAQSNENVGFLAGINPQELERALQTDNFGNLKLGALTSRKAKNSMICRRNIISLEIDFKESIPNFLSLSPDDKKSFVSAVFQKHHPIIKNRFGDIWIACFSGNSLHLHLRLGSPLDCSEANRYSQNYEFLVDHFEAILFQGEYKFDRQCKNPARLMRLPFSKNLKVKSDPIQTAVIYHNPNSDSSAVISSIWDLADDQAENVKISEQAFHTYSDNLDHKENLKKNLTFKKSLNYFNYKKAYSLKELKNGETICSSPWNTDNDPSCYLNENKKQFKDFSSGKGGDILTFIAELAGLEIKTEFKKVLELAEEITGLKKVIEIKPKTTESRQNVSLESLADKLDEVIKTKKSSKEPKPKPKTEDYFNFFEQHIPTTKRELLSGELRTFHDGAWQPTSDRIQSLGAIALDSGFYVKDHLPNYLARFAETKKPELLIDFPKWDGIDRILQIAQCIHLKNCSQMNFEQLLKEWGSILFERIENPRVQNRITVLKGGQGIGKDELIQSIVGGLGSYQTNLSISRNETDNLAMLVDHLVLNISEFDRTSRTDASTIKDWITREEATFRRPYERSHRRYQIRASFISSVNVDEILRDFTGNRRFIIFDIEKIDWTYPRNESLQILSQFKELAKVRYRASEDTQAVMKKYIQEHTPDDPKNMILDVWDDRLANLEKDQPYKGGRFTSVEVTPIIYELSRLFGKPFNTIKSMLKDNGRKKHTNQGERYFRKSTT